MTVPLTSWNPEFAARLAALPRGTALQITGHLASRRWATPGGGERFASEVMIDHVGVDVAEWWRATDSALTDLTEKER